MLAALALACVTTLPVATSDWALSRRMIDGGIVMRRYEWHLARAAASGAAAFTLTRVGMTPRTAAIVAAIGTGVLPHVVGLLRCQYPFDGPDWVADFTIAALPIAVTRGGTRFQLGVRLIGWGAAYTVTAPYARP